MSLIDVKHQGHAQRQIQQAASRDRVPHAYLFHGPDGVGKEKLANGLARLLLCEEPTEFALEGDRAAEVGVSLMREGCGACRACQAVAAGAHPDLHVIYRQLNRDHPDPEIRKRKGLDMGVDVLRHFVIDRVGLTSTLGRAKVFIIREADRMTVQAQNALLKTLEEPPGATVIILLVTAMDRLLPTTLSRCQVVRFDTLPTEFVQTKLCDVLVDLPTEQVAWYAKISEGSAGRAIQFAKDGMFEVTSRLMALLPGSPSPAAVTPPVAAPAASKGKGRQPEHVRRSRVSNPEIAKAWIEQAKALGELQRKRDTEISGTEASRRGLKAVFELAATWYADLLRFGSGEDACVVNVTHVSAIEAAARYAPAERVAEAIERIAEAERQLDLNVNTELCVEVLVNDLARLLKARSAPAALQSGV